MRRTISRKKENIPPPLAGTVEKQPSEHTYSRYTRCSTAARALTADFIKQVEHVASCPGSSEGRGGVAVTREEEGKSCGNVEKEYHGEREVICP